ncbi:MAG: hypothetical protein ACRDQX_01135 [Pseudonocardiaceae bacterium]
MDDAGKPRGAGYLTVLQMIAAQLDHDDAEAERLWKAAGDHEEIAATACALVPYALRRAGLDAGEVLRVLVAEEMEARGFGGSRRG